MHKLSPVFVHHTEGKWKTCSNLFKFFLGNVSILVMIIVLEDRLWKKVFLWWLRREKSIICRGASLLPRHDEQGPIHLSPQEPDSRSLGSPLVTDFSVSCQTTQITYYLLASWGCPEPRILFFSLQFDCWVGRQEFLFFLPTVSLEEWV